LHGCTFVPAISLSVAAQKMNVSNANSVTWNVLENRPKMFRKLQLGKYFAKNKLLTWIPLSIRQKRLKIEALLKHVCE
jgi:hypothetical protein